MSDRFHEWPLVAFTSLAGAGAGILAASAAAADRPLGLAGILGIAAGFLVSTVHLGRPLRAPLALTRVGRSALSNEVLLGGLAMAFGSAWLAAPALAPGWTIGVGSVYMSVLDPIAAASTMLRVAAAGTAALFLLALGLVYRLKGHRTWQDVAVVSPLLAGLAFGALSVYQFADARPLWTGSLAAMLLAADAAVAIGVGSVYVSARGPITEMSPLGPSGKPTRPRFGLPVHPGFFARRHVIVACRLVLFDLAPAVLLAAAYVTAANTAAHTAAPHTGVAHTVATNAAFAWAAIAVMACGLVLDRVTFYGLAVRHTTDAELAQTERLIAALRAHGPHAGTEAALRQAQGGPERSRGAGAIDH